MIAGHLTTKNGYWYLILQIRDEQGQPKSKWIATHMKATGTLTDIPASFIGYLSQLGTDCSALTTAQLQDVFADTFMLAVLFKYPEWGVPIAGIPFRAQELCYNYIHAFFDQLS